MKIIVLIGCIICQTCCVFSAEKAKIFVINSYHPTYEWSVGILKGISKVLQLDHSDAEGYSDEKSPYHVKIFDMDTKRNPSVKFAQEKAVEASSEISQWRPDVVITMDDNAFKYIVVPYYKNKELPFVFCGVNWDLSSYEGAPYRNTTGMVEVALFDPLLKQLHEIAKGKRIGFLSGDRYSDRAEAKYARKLYDVQFEKEYYVSSYSEWKQAFAALQTEVDMFIWTAVGGVDG